MSQSSPGQPQTSNAQQVSSQALLDELRTAADRARDERLKLARLVKHSAELPVNTASQQAQPGGTVSDARIAGLSEQVERLEQAVSEKLVALEQAQRDITSRTQYLESLRHTITDTTQAFMTQVEEAQHFKAHVDAAKQHVRMTAGRVVEDVRQQLTDLDIPINERINQLNDLDKQIDQRIARMQQMHKQANEAVDQHLRAALRQAQEQAAELCVPMKKEIGAYLASERAKMEAAIHDKIKELDIDVEDALTPVTERFNELVTQAQGKVNDVAKGLEPITEQIEQIVAEGEAKADLFAETLPDRIETEISKNFEALRGKIAEKAQTIIDGVDEQAMEQAGRVIHEQIARELDQYLSKAEEEAGGYVEGLIKKLDDARADSLQRYELSIGKIEIDHSLEYEQQLKKLGDEANQIKAKVDERVEHAQAILEQATDSIVTRAASIVDNALKNEEKKLADYESTAVNHLRAIDDGIEHDMESSRKRLVEFEKDTKKQGEEAIRVVEDGIAEAQKRLSGFESGINQRISLASKNADEVVDAIDGRLEGIAKEADRIAEDRVAEAQKRLAGFESGIAQRISLAVKSTDDATGSIDERLDKVEKDAARRIMQMVELAETSGNAVADSIDELAKSAETTAAQAQQDLDEKLRAFEHISAEALRTAEDVLRQNIGELRDSSRAMIEMVGRQVKAQASEIEPQTREVITQAEQTMRRRIGELRDAAQSMVDITVHRLESQLEAVKAKAQQQAFEGIDPQQGNEAA